MSYVFLIELAAVLILTKTLGYFTKKLDMTSVVGALLAGIILGPSLLNITEASEAILKISELGVLILMFMAGLETDTKEILHCGIPSLLTALLGVLTPLFMGFYFMKIFFNASFTQSLLIGIILSATSVSITSETLQELGKIKSRSATTILGAAVIDDVFSILLLSFLSIFTGGKVSFHGIIIKLILFFIFCFFIFMLGSKLMECLCKSKTHKYRMPLYSLILCLVLSFSVEHFFQISTILGAYLAGIIISNTSEKFRVKNKLGTLSYLLLSPVFFASVGLKLKITSISKEYIIFTVLLLLIAIFSKLFGCFIGSKICGYCNNDSFKVGLGMISRGEVAIIVANIGLDMNLLNAKTFGPIIIVIILTTLITPILLSIAYK